MGFIPEDGIGTLGRVGGGYGREDWEMRAPGPA